MQIREGSGGRGDGESGVLEEELQRGADAIELVAAVIQFIQLFKPLL